MIKGSKHSIKSLLKMRGKTPWNKGLTKKTDNRIRTTSGTWKKGQRISPKTEFKKGIYMGFGFKKGNKEHLGFKHTKETREKCREARLKQKTIKISRAEQIISKELKNKKIKFISQWKYHLGIADFYLPGKNLIIECNGSYWHSRPDYIERDKKKYEWLNNNGYKVLIYSSEDIIENKDNLNKIVDINLLK